MTFTQFWGDYYECSEPNSGTVEEQHALLTNPLPLKPQIVRFTWQTQRFFYRYVILILIKLSAHILWIVFQVKSVFQLEWFYDDEIFISIIKMVDGNFLEVQFSNMWEHSVFYLSPSYSYNCFKLGKHVHETFCQLCAVHSYP